MTEFNYGRKFLSKKAVAQRYGLHPATLMRLVREGKFPKPVKPFGGVKSRVFWDTETIAKWEEEKMRGE